ncbi:hypothetical protein BKA66DRAFT_536672 [Pyrenochaeta sp. MPI-SDFR-AT-0127]|nr:hypothetical protein BKA66DRAFT_536672 [Pyrenochaeta sp. MPI-SDFR-AT-0127]
MADPLSVAGSIAGLLSIADVVFRKLYKYVKTVKKAEKEVLSFKTEVATLTGVLHNLHIIAEELEDDSTFDNVLQIDHVASCSITLERIDALLSEMEFPKDRKFQSALQKLKWPFKTSETQEISDEVRRHRETLSLALSADTMVALLQCLSSQKDIINRLDRLQETIQRREDIEVGIALDEDRRRILKSFFIVEPRPYYETSLKLRHSGTGSWLYRDPIFQSWLQEPGSRLWLTGIPGAGKTVLSGSIIQRCIAMASESKAIAYYYCDYKNTNTQNVVSIFSALAGQIAIKNEASFLLLKEYYEQLHTSDQMERQPKIEELIKLIHKMAAAFDDVRIIVDGLDECGEDMAGATEWLHKLVCAPYATISLALLSREEQAIRSVFDADGTYDHVEITAHTEDVERYVRSEIEERIQKRRLRIRNPELKLLIIRELVSRAGGMFRWVACQIDHLCDLATDSQRRKALNELPKDLNETYERILSRVKDHAVPLVAKTLQWLAHGTPSLEVDALLEALSIDDNSDTLDPEARPTEEDLLLYCSSLVRKTGVHLELAHFTVQEYLLNLTSDHGHLGQFRLAKDSKAVFAKTCLSYLCLPAFNQPLEPVLGDILSFRDQFPFHAHASIAWAGYMDNSWDNAELSQLYHRLFDPKKTQNFILCTFQRIVGVGMTNENKLTRNSHYSIPALVCDEEFQPLHAAAIFGLTEVCQWLVQQGCDVNVASPLGVPLQLCLLGLFNAYTLLDFDITSVEESALTSTARFLVDAGADCNRIDHSRFQHLSANGEDIFDVFKFLRSFEHGKAKPLSEAYSLEYDDTFFSRLIHCIARDQVERVKELSEDPRFPSTQSSDENENDLLHWAAIQRAVQTMNFLLDLGFNPALRDPSGHNVLDYCVDLDNDDILFRLVASSGITDPAEDGVTIWHSASAAGAFRLLELLVENCSEVVPKLLDIYNERTPLMYSIGSGSEPSSLLLAQTMRAQGMPLNDPAILHSCVAMGFTQLFAQLVDYGVNAQTTTESRRSAWFFVTSLTTSDIFEMLSNSGMDPLSRDDVGMTPLHALLNGARLLNIHKEVTTNARNRVNNDAILWRLDVITDAMLDHLLTPASAQAQDDSGHTAWFYFCTKYIPRIINSQNVLVNETPETLARRLVLNQAIEAYENGHAERNGVDLFLENCLNSFRYVNDRCEGLIGRLIKVIITCEGFTIDDEKPIMTRLFVWSIENKEKAIFDVLLNCGINIQSSNTSSKGCSALGTAAFGFGDLPVFTELMKHARLDRLNEPDGTGLTPVHAACQARDKPVDSIKRLKILLEAGADPNALTTYGNRTPLHLAARDGSVEHVQVLLENGADVALRDENSYDAVAFAVLGGNIKILPLLEASSGNTTTSYDDNKYEVASGGWHSSGCTLAHLATLHDEVEMLDHLRSSGRLNNVHIAADDGKTPLYFAATFAAIKCTKWLLNNGADPNATTHEKRRSALHVAVAHGDFSLIRLLVSSGAKFLKDKWGLPPDALLPKEKRRQFYQAIKGLQTPGPVPIKFLPPDVQPLFSEIRRGNINACLTIIQKDPRIVSLPSQDCGTCTPLIVALEGAHSGIVNLLLSNGATTAGYKCSMHSSRESDICGGSSIHVAITRPELNSKLPLLLQLSLQEQNNSWSGITPVHVAAALNPAAIDLLHAHFIANSERYAEVDFQMKADFSCTERYPRLPRWGQDDTYPLHIAAYSEQTKAVTSLLGYGADIQSRDGDGSTALHRAVIRDFYDVAEILLAHGADPSARDQWMCTPLMLCAEQSSVNLARLLLDHGADRMAVEANGETALSLCAARGRLDMFMFLIEAGCDPIRKNRVGGHSALGIALKFPRLATYIYAQSFDLDHLIPDKPEDFALVRWRDPASYLKQSLRFLSRETRVKMLQHESVQYPHAFVQAAMADAVVDLKHLVQAGADIEFSSRNGSALIAACTTNCFKSVKFLVYHGAKYESMVDGKSITALQAARHSPGLVQWLLVGRYTEQPKLTDFSSQTSQSIKCWSGVRQLKIPLYGIYKRSHRQARQSLFKYVCWVYRHKESWRHMVPPSWKPEAHIAALPGEKGHPLPVCFSLRIKLDVEHSLEEVQDSLEKHTQAIELREQFEGGADDVGAAEAFDHNFPRRDSGSEENLLRPLGFKDACLKVDVQGTTSSLAPISVEPYTNPTLGVSSTNLLLASVTEDPQVMTG